MTREITFRDAISEALAEEFDRHPEMILMGEDILAQGGVFGVHAPLVASHRDRLIETPIAEPGFMGGHHRHAHERRNQIAINLHHGRHSPGLICGPQG